MAASMLAAPVVAALAPASPRAASPRGAAAVALPPLRPLPRPIARRLGGCRPRLPLPPAVPSQATNRRAAGAPPARRRRGLGVPMALLALLLLLAALLAPEAPQDQAAICQRHNGAVACRVW